MTRSNRCAATMCRPDESAGPTKVPAGASFVVATGHCLLKLHQLQASCSLQALSSHQRNRKSMCETRVTHSNRLGQGAVEPVPVPGSLGRKEWTDLTMCKQERDSEVSFSYRR